MAGTVYIVIYTLYHHIYKLALEIQKGLEEAGVKTKIYQGNKTRSKSKWPFFAWLFLTKENAVGDSIGNTHG